MRLRALREDLDLVKAQITKDVHLERGSEGKLVYFTAEFRRAEVKLRLASDERAKAVKEEMSKLEQKDEELLSEWNEAADEREYLFRRLEG